MKRLIAFVMVMVLMVILCGCNMSLGLGSLSFEKAHVDTYNYSGCFTVEKWYENETGIEVKTKEAGNLFLSEGTYFLIGKDCPFCSTKEGDVKE